LDENVAITVLLQSVEMKYKERVAKSFFIKDIYGKKQITGAKRLNKDRNCMRCQNH